jgi:hypothetical protein
MPNVVPFTEIDDDEISPGTRPDYARHVVQPKPHRRLSIETEYTLSQKSLSSTDSSVPRRLVRAIPDLRIFKFVKKRNHEQKIEEQKRLELEAENARLDREPEEKKRKTQFQIPTTANSHANRPRFIRLPDKLNQKWLGYPTKSFRNLAPKHLSKRSLVFSRRLETRQRRNPASHLRIL